MRIRPFAYLCGESLPEGMATFADVWQKMIEEKNE
jgi:hypothetical protein